MSTNMKRLWSIAGGLLALLTLGGLAVALVLTFGGGWRDAKPGSQAFQSPIETPVGHLNTIELTYTPGEPSDCVVHVAESGQALSEIARQYGVSVQAMMEVNPDIKDPNNIKLGQNIAIPGQYDPQVCGGTGGQEEPFVQATKTAVAILTEQAQNPTTTPVPTETATPEATATQTATPEPTATKEPSGPKEIKAKMAKSKINIYNVPQSKKKHGKVGFDLNHNRYLIPQFTVLNKVNGWYFVDFTSFDNSNGMGASYGSGWVRAKDIKLLNGQEGDIPVVWWADPDPKVQEQGFENWVETVPLEGFSPGEEKQIREALLLIKYVQMPPSWKPKWFDYPFVFEKNYQITSCVRKIIRSKTDRTEVEPNGMYVILNPDFFNYSSESRSLELFLLTIKEAYTGCWTELAPNVEKKRLDPNDLVYSDIMSMIMPISAAEDLLKQADRGKIYLSPKQKAFLKWHNNAYKKMLSDVARRNKWDQN